MDSIIQKIFPETKNISKKHLLTYDDEGMWSITLPEDADTISTMIKNDLGNNISIFDGTAGLGGNVLSFAQFFKKVIGIEQCEQRFKLLEKNISVYGYNNITLYNGNCIDYIQSCECDAYFFDPPWGGPEYKKGKEITFKLGDYNLNNIVTILKERNKYVVFKLPTNYDISNFNTFNYKLNKINKYIILTF